MREESVLKPLVKLSLPVMFALLIQSFYNIADSFFVAKVSENALTALSIIYPLQLLLNAIANGTAIGINTLVSRYFGMGRKKKVKSPLRTGLMLMVISYVVFAVITVGTLKLFFQFSTDVAETVSYGLEYGYIVFAFSIFVFLESMFTKVLQAKEDMVTPMKGQVAGAIVNIVLDPILIFVLGFGVKGAAIATVLGQAVAAIIVALKAKKVFEWNGKVTIRAVKDIYYAAIPQIILQSLYTVYIMGLNIILVDFGEEAVTVLGIYYKLQTFFFIPETAFMQVLIPVVSYHYGAGNKDMILNMCKASIFMVGGFMFAVMCIFMAIPETLIGIFSQNNEVKEIGSVALRVISISFVPSAIVFMLMTFLQATDNGIKSIVLAVLRQLLLLVPLAWVFSHVGLNYTWCTFPVTEIIVMTTAIVMYFMVKKELTERFKNRVKKAAV